MMDKPRLLDLFCGAGGCSVGYSRAGFEVVGVDIKAQPHYPFEFHRGDALEYLAAHGREFDAIHASPSCQAYTCLSNRWRGKGSLADNHPALIAATRDRLNDLGRPYVIENVPGAGGAMRNAIRLTGEMFSLRVHRPRIFESNIVLLSGDPRTRQKNPVAVYGKEDGRRLWTRTDGSELRASDMLQASMAMGIGWMDWDELTQAIPPAYTEFIGKQLMRVLERQH